MHQSEFCASIQIPEVPCFRPKTRETVCQKKRTALQVRDLGREDQFNYELQYTRMFDEQHEVKNGDVVVATCIFDSMDRTEPTRGGLASKEEMCLNSILVYPATCCTACSPFCPTCPEFCHAMRCLMHCILLTDTRSESVF